MAISASWVKDGPSRDLPARQILVRCAAKLAFGPVGESPAGGNCPVATVVISGNGEGDRAVESPEVKVSDREASNSAGRSNGEPVSPEIDKFGSAEPEADRRRQERVAKELDIRSERLPGDVEDDMLGWTER